jgi:hypothetical protein
VFVVRLIKLVFNEHEFPFRKAFAHNVGAEITDGLLGGLEFKAQPDGLAEERQVIVGGKPGRESLWFSGPNIGYKNFLQTGDGLCGHSQNDFSISVRG